MTDPATSARKINDEIFFATQFLQKCRAAKINVDSEFMYSVLENVAKYIIKPDKKPNDM